MKKVLLLLILLQSTLGLRAQYSDWTGAVSTDWHNPANWSPQSVPDSTRWVRIGTASQYPVLSNSVRVNRLLMNSGQLSLGAHTLRAEQVGIRASTLLTVGGTLRATEIDSLFSSGISGSLHLELEAGIFSGNTFGGDLTLYAHHEDEDGFHGMVYLSYEDQDTFLGNATFHLENEIYLSIQNGVNFEQKTTFELTNPNEVNLTMVEFPLLGGDVIFRDSTTFQLNSWSSGIFFRSRVDFQGVVTFENHGGQVNLAHWYAEPLDETLFTFRKGIIINQSAGHIALGGWDYNTDEPRTFAIIDSTARLKTGAQGITSGFFDLINVLIYSPHTELLAATHPAGGITPRTYIGISNTEVKGDLWLKADHLVLSENILHRKVTLNKDGWYPYPGDFINNTFHGPVSLLNTAGSDWDIGTYAPNVFKDSLYLYMNGEGQKNLPGSTRGAFFKVGLVSGTRIEGPLTVVTSSYSWGDIHIGTAAGSVELFSGIDISGYRAGWMYFNNCKFRGEGLARTLENHSPHGSAFHFYDNTLFEGPVSITVPRLRINHSTFLKPTVFTKTYAGDDTSVGGNTFHGQVQFLNTAASGQLHLLSGQDKLIK